MDTNEVLKIIRACAQHDVREFAQGDLKLSFYPKNEVLAPKAETSAKISTKIPQPVEVPPIVTKAMDKIADEENTKAAIREVAEEADNLLLTDPLEYEERLARGELVDDPQVQH